MVAASLRKWAGYETMSPMTGTNGQIHKNGDFVHDIINWKKAHANNSTVAARSVAKLQHNNLFND